MTQNVKNDLDIYKYKLIFLRESHSYEYEIHSLFI